MVDLHILVLYFVDRLLDTRQLAHPRRGLQTIVLHVRDHGDDAVFGPPAGTHLVDELSIFGLQL